MQKHADRLREDALIALVEKAAGGWVSINRGTARAAIVRRETFLDTFDLVLREQLLGVGKDSSDIDRRVRRYVMQIGFGIRRALRAGGIRLPVLVGEEIVYGRRRNVRPELNHGSAQDRDGVGGREE